MKALRIAAATLQLILALGASARADVFHSSYLSFELPLGWKCNQEGIEWVCEDQVEGKQKTAIIILTAKEQGNEDRLVSIPAWPRSGRRRTRTTRAMPGEEARSVCPPKAKVRGSFNVFAWPTKDAPQSLLISSSNAP